VRSAAIALALLLAAGGARAQVQMCAADLDADGDIAQAETATCADLPGGALCPLQQTACTMTPGPEGLPPSFACPLNPARACVEDGNGGASCSPHACFERSGVPAEIFEPADPAPANNGPRDGAGNCIGDLQVFAGESTRCRRAGAETLFHNCCANKSSVIHDSGGGFGSIGMKLKIVQTIGGAASVAATSGLEAANAFLLNSFNPTTMAIGLAVGVLMDMLLQTCDARDMEAALLKDSGYCVRVGNYCAERWPLIGCVQRAERHCCFNSKLARIVQEQGRAQLPSMGGFGTPEDPDCRGFRPEEFQAIDFSKIDLSEYFDELTTRSQAVIEGEIRSNVQSGL
jgi:conjugal transfer mating pair stabilization protein TraN